MFFVFIFLTLRVAILRLSSVLLLPGSKKGGVGPWRSCTASSARLVSATGDAWGSPVLWSSQSISLVVVISLGFAKSGLHDLDIVGSPIRLDTMNPSSSCGGSLLGVSGVRGSITGSVSTDAGNSVANRGFDCNSLICAFGSWVEFLLCPLWALNCGLISQVLCRSGLVHLYVHVFVA